MISKTFKIKKIDLEKKPLTVFQHKLRVLMRCYTIRDLILNEIELTYRFKKSHKINGLKMDDPKEYSGKYEIELSEDPRNVILKLMV